MKINLALFLLFGQIVFFSGCASFPSGSSEAWSAGEREKAKGSVQIISVSAERPGDWGSLEKEISALLPLLFSEESYLVVSAQEAADYSADATVREREYLSGWQTKRSLSAEIRIWKGDGSEPLPITAGRSLIQGKQSLASSATLASMLKKAIKSAVRGLPAKNSDDLSGAE